MTTKELKQIAEACGYEVRDNLVRDHRGCIGSVLPPETDDWGEVPDEIERFRPDLDANRAIECLDRRFVEWEPHCWQEAKSHKRWYRISGAIWDESRKRSTWHETRASYDTFPLAAMNAILESLK